MSESAKLFDKELAKNAEIMASGIKSVQDDYEEDDYTADYVDPLKLSDDETTSDDIQYDTDKSVCSSAPSFSESREQDKLTIMLTEILERKDVSVSNFMVQESDPHSYRLIIDCKRVLYSQSKARDDTETCSGIICPEYYASYTFKKLLSGRYVVSPKDIMELDEFYQRYTSGVQPYLIIKHKLKETQGSSWVKCNLYALEKTTKFSS